MSSPKAVTQETNSNSIRVSPRHLGQMRRSDFCPRCFWYSVALGFRHPFDMPMAGIMYNLDIFEKALVEAHFVAKGTGPKWLSSLGCSKPVSFPRKMTQEFPSLGLTLVGMPDAVFAKKDGSLCVVDYKTARYKGPDDPFMPGYEVQLWGYAQLLQHHEIGSVSSAALVYFENSLAAYSDKPLDLLSSGGMTVPFTVKIHQIVIDLKELNSLLKDFRRFVDMEAPPVGMDNCKTCGRLDFLFETEIRRRNNVKAMKNLVNKDSVQLNYIMNYSRSQQREDRTRESRGWEDYFTDSSNLDYDCVPGALDI